MQQIPFLKSLLRKRIPNERIMNKEKYFDFVIVGQGLAGLAAAYYTSEQGTVALVSKENFNISNSYLAQGGIASAISPDDSIKQHYKDTIAVGKNLCNKKAVKILVAEGKNIVREIISLGMKFDRNNSELDISLEGGHSRRRVLHSNGSSTGKELVRFFRSLIAKNKNITLFGNSFLFRILVRNGDARGAQFYNYKTQKNFQLLTNRTIIASGGLAGIYLKSTNPLSTSGDGIIAAYNAGAEIENIEFIQFHPTALNKKSCPPFLLSEALRGDGALLVENNGKRIFSNTELTELSPRDELSKAIYQYISAGKNRNVFLSLSQIEKSVIRRKFSYLLNELKKYGIDIITSGIPVAPAAHYTVGGIKTGLFGETNITGLYAIGEAASAGVHGANRLASNSLLECLVFAKRCVQHRISSYYTTPIKPEPESSLTIEDKKEKIFHKVRNQIAKILWEDVGIIRNAASLIRAKEKLSKLREKYSIPGNEYYLLQIQNFIQLALLITNGALARKESRGCHIRSDYPNQNKKFEHNSSQINKHTRLLKIRR